MHRLIDAGAVDIVNFDASKPAASWRRAAAAACALVDIRMAHHENHQIAAHMLAAIPHGICVNASPIPRAIRCGRTLLPGARPKDGMLAVARPAGLRHHAR